MPGVLIDAEVAAYSVLSAFVFMLDRPMPINKSTGINKTRKGDAAYFKVFISLRLIQSNKKI